jgi:hypothetical protein
VGGQITGQFMVLLIRLRGLHVLILEDLCNGHNDISKNSDHRGQ